MSKENKLLEIQEEAFKRQGICLSNNYVNNRSKLTFRCKLNHLWETSWKNINKGSWCPECALIKLKGKNNPRFDCIANMQQIAKERGGVCLSTEYLGAINKLKWRCLFGHEWLAKPSSIKNGTWCPQCSIGIGERICRLIFETIFNKTFLKVRPNWLVNPISNRNLELDGYCEELGIAFEYNGDQHYTDSTFYPRSKYDDFKIQKCYDHNIKLFLIKEIKSVNHYNEIINQIIIQAKKFNLNINTNIDICISEIYNTNSASIFLEELKRIAQKNGGKCLSDQYLDNKFKLNFLCGKCNYIWKCSPKAIKNGTWCPNCANKIKTIENAIELANLHNGKCLSNEYINSIKKMNWECHLGHQWKASYNQIQSGNWCPHCFKINRGKYKKLKINVYKLAALNKNGKCLSDDIASCYDKLEWQCDKGHRWFARADLIKNTKQWCPKCAYNKLLRYKN